MAKNERRQWSRFPAHWETRYQIANDRNAPWLPARIQNVSQGGIQVLVHEKHEPGNLLHIQLPHSRKEKSPEFLTCILHISETPDASFALGGSFIRELSQAELQAFLAPERIST